MKACRVRSTRLPGLAAVLLAATAIAQAGEPGPIAELPYRPGLDLTSMDLAADPCEDFYQYSCGGWIKQNPLPPGQSTWDVYRKLADDNLHLLWGLLVSAAEQKDDRPAITQQAGDHFAACMDTDLIEELGVSPLSPTLTLIDAVASREEVAALLGRLHDTGANGATTELEAKLSSLKPNSGAF